MPDSATRSRRKVRYITIDPIMSKRDVAKMLGVSVRSVERILSESLIRREGLWPQLNHRGRVAVHASTVSDYISALPTLEDAPTDFTAR